MAKNISIEDLLPELELGQTTPTEAQAAARAAAQAAAQEAAQTASENIRGQIEVPDESDSSVPPSDLPQDFIPQIADPSDRQSAAEAIEYVQSLQENRPNLVDTKKISVEIESLAVGRELTVIPENVYGVDKNQYKLNSEPSKNFVFTTDALRGRSANYWSIDDLGRGVEYVSKQNRVSEISPYTIRYGPSSEIKKTPTDFGIGTEQFIYLTGEVDKFQNGISDSQFSPDLWKAYIRGEKYTGATSRGQIDEEFNPAVVIGELFTDHVHRMALPFSRKELDKFSSPLNAFSAHIEPEYNFYVKSYETKIMEDPGVMENTLPNMYVFLSELNQDQPNPEFKKFISLDESLRINRDSPSSFNQFVGVFNNKKREFDIKTHPIGQYYDIYARQYDRAKNRGAVTRLNKKFSNLLVAADEISILKDFNEKREMFPMYVDIEFSTDKSTTFAQILKDSNLSEAFMTRVVNRVINNEASVIPCQQAIEDIVQVENANPISLSSLSGKQKRFWPVIDIIKNLIEVQEELDSSATYLGEYANTLKTLNGKQYDLFKSIMFRIFFGKLKKMVKEKFRSFEEILDGKPAYSETVFYRVAKYVGDVDGELVQNYYFPNSNELDVVRFIDTQVKYNKQYTYVVYAYQLVFGNRYAYNDLQIEELKNQALFKATNIPDLLLFEHEFYKFTGKVLDDSPVAPDVEIVPYKGIDDRVLILMNSNVGNFLQEPIVIKPKDRDRIEDFRKQRELDAGSPIRFKADDHVGKFEVYRLENHPQSYNDFQNGLRTVIDLENSKQMATAGSFIDKIEPNKKYYYTFRSIDVHDNFSNPTPIVRIELINENGTIFLLKDIVNFAEEPKTSSKQARKYIQLVPSVLQSLINEEKSGYERASSATQIARQIHLGDVDESVWGKNFKIRLTSKSSGKKVDFFVKFEHEHKEKA